ncbi:MAG: hypothetical protein H7329_13740 [Opitutaceae bacterium]|nr:hypothetical protein [Cytophagales bacterium]
MTYSNSLAFQKLPSRSERAIWKRDFTYCLNWISLPIMMVPVIGLLTYFICYDTLVTSEVVIYFLVFIFFGIFSIIGIDNFLMLREHIENLKEKPDFIKKPRSTNAESQY